MAPSSVTCLCWHLDVKSCTGHAVLARDCWPVQRGISVHFLCLLIKSLQKQMSDWIQCKQARNNLHVNLSSAEER